MYICIYIYIYIYIYMYIYNKDNAINTKHTQWAPLFTQCITSCIFSMSSNHHAQCAVQASSLPGRLKNYKKRDGSALRRRRGKYI